MDRRQITASALLLGRSIGGHAVRQEQWVIAQTREEYESARRAARCLLDEYEKLPEDSPYRDYYIGHSIILAESLVDSPASPEED